MKRIPLTRGFFAKVDDADFERLSKLKWYARTGHSGMYAATGDRTVLMHRMLLPGAPQVDHINHDTLDNRRANLREATTSQNKMNERRRKDNTSGFKGVAWHKGRRKWCAHIGKDRVKYYLGYFLVVEDAARAYDAEARKRFGEFACVNFPIKQETKNIDKET